jgi:hypothetical protein
VSNMVYTPNFYTIALHLCSYQTSTSLHKAPCVSEDAISNVGEKVLPGFSNGPCEGSSTPAGPLLRECHHLRWLASTL